MKNKSIYIFTTLLLIAQFISAQQKLQFRIGIGNGKPFSSEKHIYSTQENPNVIFGNTVVSGRQIKKVFNRVFSNPQIVYMLEYKINKSNLIGFGLQHGRTELLVINPNGSTATGGGTLRKIGFEYVRTLKINEIIKTNNQKLNRLYCSFLVGIFSVHHKYNDYGTGKIISVSKDLFGNSIDSTTSDGFILNNHGIITSLGVRFGLFNKRNKEKLSFTFLYDYGFTNLWQLNSYSYFNYLNEHINTTQVSRGSQFKIW